MMLCEQTGYCHFDFMNAKFTMDTNHTQEGRYSYFICTLHLMLSVRYTLMSESGVEKKYFGSNHIRIPKGLLYSHL